MLVFFALDFDVCPWCADPHGIPISSRRVLRSPSRKRQGGRPHRRVGDGRSNTPARCLSTRGESRPAHPSLRLFVGRGRVEGQRIGRKLRKDGLCLLAGVISAPDDMAAEVWESMKQEAIAWLNQDGRLVSVAEHADEAHRHVHFYKIPAPGARFETLHPGRAAALEAKADGALRGEQNRAYKEAMRGFQDDFFEQVGARHGLTRLGPAKRRLTRSEWKNEQVAALSLANAMAKAEQMLAIAASASTSAADAQATADKAK